MNKPRIILHIGRNKAGSTTIQNACLQSRNKLARHGIGYGLFGHLWQSNAALPGWMTFHSLADHARAHSHMRWLVSNEFMSAWPAEFTREARDALDGCDVTILAYIRRYDHWIRSAYVEDTRAGANALDIDDYLKMIQPRLSALPILRDWANCFGWERMRVRSLDRTDLAGADLLSDFAQAIDLHEPLACVPDSNVAPHWIEVELIRALATHAGAHYWADWNRAVVLPLVRLLRPLCVGQPDTVYLTADRTGSLIDMYNSDAVALRTHGQRVTPVADVPTPRAAQPHILHAPERIMQAFFDAATMPDFIEAHPQAGRVATSLAGDLWPTRSPIGG